MVDALVTHRPDLSRMPESAYPPVSAATHLVADLASGRFDVLSGRFIHVRDDREALLARALSSRTDHRPPRARYPYMRILAP